MDDNDENNLLNEKSQSMYKSADFNLDESQNTRSSLRNSQSLEEVDTESYDQFIEISVTDPQKIGDGMGSYIAYKVTTKTNMPKFRKNQFSVIRRFSDFLGKESPIVDN